MWPAVGGALGEVLHGGAQRRRRWAVSRCHARGAALGEEVAGRGRSRAGESQGECGPKSDHRLGAGPGRWLHLAEV